MSRGNGIRDFYSEIVLPALATRLDVVFPEFGWRRDAHGWIATNDEMTHQALGVRAGRVVAHGSAPPGFLIHGGEPMLWTAYLNGGVPPHGDQFVNAVRQLAERAGVDTEAIERPGVRDRRNELLETFMTLCREELLGENGAVGRAYLERRAIPEGDIEGTGLGVVPARQTVRALLHAAGYHDGEIEAAGILADSRWPGRIVGAWRDERGKVGTYWARALVDSEDTGARYLYLRGASRLALPPYGFTRAGLRPRGDAERLVLVEGFFDVLQLRAQEVPNVAGIGGTAITTQTFEQLRRLGVGTVVLALDNDGAGRAGIAKAVENAVRARDAPAVFVVDPSDLGSAKDPDEFVRRHGRRSFLDLVDGAGCGIAWRASELAGRVDASCSVSDRRAALTRAGRWLGSLPPRLAFEQEDAVSAVAAECGYSPEAARRSFRARFWPERESTLGRVRSSPAEPELGL